MNVSSSSTMVNISGKRFPRYSRSQLTPHNPSQLGADHLDFAVSVSRMSNPMKASQHADLFLLKLCGVDATMQLVSEAGTISELQTEMPSL